jgi:uncharacterized protein YdeI (YjbR/CyaY-like superfamily)
MLVAEKENGKTEIFDPESRQAWHDWLSKNHHSSKGVWLVIRKKNSRKDGINLENAIEEAVAFGWVDSKLNVHDKDSFRLIFTPRQRGSIWSKSNKQRVEKLTKQGLMTPAGNATVEAAKQDGSWNRLDSINELKLPQDFRSALASDQIAQKTFDGYSDSVKKQILWWLESAKRKDTRQKRIEQATAWAAQGKNPPW